MPFSTEKLNEIVIERVNISRATFKEAEEFKKKLDNHIEMGFSKIIVDLSECAFMDSTFLSTIITALKKVSKSEGNLKLVAVSEEIQSLLELTGTAKVFEIYKKRNDAVKSFKIKAA